MKRPIIILAGGRGTRLGALTEDIPKPMIDIEGKPFLYWLIIKYIFEGFTDITLSIGYKSEVIENYPWGLNINFRKDTEYRKDNWIYDTADNDLIVNGDTWIKEDLPKDRDNAWILVCNDVDAGAQYIKNGKIKVYSTPKFYDIGTPYGLEVFREYFKTQLHRF